jgi:hypothetical protein
MIDQTVEERILTILKKCVGEKSAIKDTRIREIIYVPDGDPRKPTAGLRQIINSLRQKGEPICSSVNGYWYAGTPEELQENIEALEGRAIKIFEATKGMKECLRKWVGPQQSLL